MLSIPPDHDLVLLFTALNAACDADVLRRIAAAGFADLRPAHGYVFQHIMEQPIRVSDLARRLGMTAQGASKLVIEMEGMGYVLRHPDPDDQRNRFVALTDRGWAAIEAGRAARAAISADLRNVLGDADGRALLEALQRLAEHTGGPRELLGRRPRPGR